MAWPGMASQNAVGFSTVTTANLGSASAIWNCIDSALNAEYPIWV